MSRYMSGDMNGHSMQPGGIYPAAPMTGQPGSGTRLFDRWAWRLNSGFGARLHSPAEIGRSLAKDAGKDMSGPSVQDPAPDSGPAPAPDPDADLDHWP